jgi:hypothetical protein
MDADFTAILVAHYPGEADRYFLPMFVGTNAADADEGAAEILSGTKTLTSSPFWAFADGRLPFVGALSVLLNGSRHPVAIVETTRIEIMPFNAITDELAFAMAKVSARRLGGAVQWAIGIALRLLNTAQISERRRPLSGNGSMLAGGSRTLGSAQARPRSRRCTQREVVVSPASGQERKLGS